MSELLNQLNDDELDFSVSFEDTDGNTVRGDFLDIVVYEKNEYVIIDPEDGDGYVDIFRIMGINSKEVYVRVTDDDVLDNVFRMFRIKNEDEFDFD